MAENTKKSPEEEIRPEEETVSETASQPPPSPTTAKQGGGWGGWGFSPLSYLSDLQKAATTAAEEISRNAVEVAKTAAKNIADMQNIDEDPESSKEDATEASAVEEVSDDENDKRRKDALDKLEKASEDSLLGQGIKVLDNSVEYFASGAWQAFGNAWKGGSDLVHKLENSAANLAETIQHGALPGAAGSVAPSLIESGKALTAKGMQVLELVGKETMDLLISETGMEVDKDTKEAEEQVDEDQLFEEVSFDRCFYIYGGPEQLEELEALSNHYALLFNRRKLKLSSEQKSVYDGKLKQVQQMFNLSSETDGNAIESEKGKKVENSTEGNIDEMKNLHDSSVSKAAELAAGLENSAANLAETIQHGALPGAAGSVAPSLIESGKALTAKGMQVLELVGKETMDLLISETGMEVDKDTKEAEEQVDEDQLFEEVSFDRCFYIYGGPEQLEELEALSNHYALLFNRRKLKLSSEQKSVYDGKLKQVQQMFNLSSETDGNAIESEKGKKVENSTEGNIDEMKNLHDSSVSKAAELAAGFANALAGLAPNDVIQRTAGRLDSIHSEGVHRLSEMCCFAVSQLLMLGKSIISNANKVEDQDMLNIDWPGDSVEKAKIIRTKAQSMTGNVEAVSNSFITGISDVAEVYVAAIKGAIADADKALPQKSIQEKANAFSENLRVDRTTAMGKIQDGLQYLSYVVLSTSMPAA
ncbi:unnamed protein product [Ilex paraguariensis]|uniref:DUF7798 domain-containing protein n=1 Tax=Ilex paraguariensis TaxID=185542 RepID=A0ABC8S0X1_9AQUA